MKRINVTLSDDTQEWVEHEAEKMGVAQSAIIAMALKFYIDQQKAINISQDIQKLLDVVSSINNDTKKEI